MISAALLNGRGRPSSRCSAAEPAARLHPLRPAFLPAKTTCRSSAGCTRNAPAEGWQGRWDARPWPRDDVVDARRKRMRKLAAEIHRFAADAAHGLCSIDFLFVALKGQTVRAVTVWARNSLWHMRLLGHGLLCTIGKEPLQAGGLLRGGSAFKAHGCFAGPGVSKKPPGRSERREIRGQCAAAHNSSLLGRIVRNPLGCMLPRTEDDATMTYIYPMTPPGCRP